MSGALDQMTREWRGILRPGAIPGVAGSGVDETGTPAADLAAAAPAPDGGGGLGAELSAQLSVTLGRISDHLDAIQRQQAARWDGYLRDPYAIPWGIPISAPLTLGPVNGFPSGSGLVDLGGPAQGYEWRVRRVSICDAQSFTASMGAAAGQFYEAIPTDAPATATMRPQSVIWPFASLPNVATFGQDEVPLRFGEHLVAVVTGGNVNQNLIVSARFQIISQAQLRPATEDF